MTNIATTASVIDHTSDAGFRTWVAEIITQFTSVLGLVQTGDTGQINTSTVVRPGTINSAAGYSIFRFSDTLQSTSPVFIKLEYGNGNALTAPLMFITLGQGSNGSGTLTGNLTTASRAVSVGSGAASTVTSYTSHFVVNMTLGYVALIWKMSGSSINVGLGAFILYRSNDTSGAPTGDSINLITNGLGPAGTASQPGVYQGYSYLTTLLMPNNGTPTAAQGGAWLGANAATGFPFNLTSSLFSGNSYLVPVYYMTPAICISAYNCAALGAEVAIGTTFSAALVGSTPLTFLNISVPFGGANLGVTNTSAVGLCILWQ